MISLWVAPQAGPFPGFSWRAVLCQAVTCRSSALEVALRKTQANLSPESAFPPHFQCPPSFVRGGYSTWDVFVPTSTCSIEPTMHWRAASWVKWALVLWINCFSAVFILNHYFLLKQKFHGTMSSFLRGFASSLTGNASLRHYLRMSLESTWFGGGLLLSLWVMCPGDDQGQCKD